MAILCLATSLKDLKNRLGNIVIGYNVNKEELHARDFDAHGAMTVLLKDAMKPNIVQTLENNIAFIHGGPFANIAHGCNSVIATKTALKLATESRKPFPRVPASLHAAAVLKATSSISLTWAESSIHFLKAAQSRRTGSS